jgi:RNA polymerase sigma-B factor
MYRRIAPPQHFSKTMPPPLNKLDKFRDFQQARLSHHAAIERRLLKELLIEHKPLAIDFAQRQATTCPEDLEDLIQLAMIGLAKAVQRFDPELGNAFSSFAERWIRGEILHHVRDNWSGAKIPRRQVEKHGEVLRTQRNFAKAGRQLTTEEIAVAIGMSAEQWRDLEGGMRRIPMLSFDGGVTGVALRMPEEDHREELRNEVCRQVADLEAPTRLYVMDKFFRGLDEGTIARNYNVATEAVAQAIAGALVVLAKRIDLEAF